MSNPEIDLQTTDSYTIKEAAAVVGRSELTIRRRIDKNRFPGAEMRRGTSGDEWHIPAVDLAAVAQEDGWQINLDHSGDQSDDGPSSDLLRAVEARVRAESEIELLSKDIQSLTDQASTLMNERDQARSDLEYTKSELDRIAGNLAEETKATAVAEARIEELRNQVDQAEKLRLEVVQERDSLDLEHREFQKQSAESISELSGDLDSARSEAGELVGERDELAKKLAEAEASMGWWTRRKYLK